MEKLVNGSCEHTGQLVAGKKHQHLLRPSLTCLRWDQRKHTLLFSQISVTALVSVCLSEVTKDIPQQ